MEYGFAMVAGHKDEFDLDPVNRMPIVRHMVLKYYQQYVDYVTEQGGNLDFAKCAVYMVRCPSLSDATEAEVHYAWYVNDDPDFVPAEHYELLKEAVNGQA